MKEATHINNELVPSILMALIKALGFKLMMQSHGGYGKAMYQTFRLIKDN